MEEELAKSLTIEQVSNGFIVSVDGDPYSRPGKQAAETKVFETLDSLQQFIKRYYMKEYTALCSNDRLHRVDDGNLVEMK